MYKLYVIPGSHACRSAMLMLEHKRVPYRRVEFVTLMHPVAARLRGFDAGGQTRTAGGKRPLGPADGRPHGHRARTGRGQGADLDQPRDRPLPGRSATRSRRCSRPIPRAGGGRGGGAVGERTAPDGGSPDPGGGDRARPRDVRPSAGDGRLGHLLYKRERTRRLIIPRIIGGVFATSGNPERDPVDELPALLDRIDAWIGEGVLGGAGAQRRGFHGRAQPGADPLPARRHADVRGPPGARARGSALPAPNC